MPATLSEESEPLNILYYGPGGGGKTTDIMAMAKLGKIWVANAESGVKARALRQHGIPVENIEVFPDPDDPKEELTYEGLEKEWLRIREALHKDPTAYIGTCWDSVTEIQQALKDVEVTRSVAKANRRGQEREPFVVDQDNWRTVNEQCRALIRKYRDLPCHFAMTALERREQDNDGAVVYMPSVTPGLQNDLIGWVDVVCHTDPPFILDEDEIYMGSLRNLGKYQGKDRFKATPRKLRDPMFDRVLGYIDGSLTIDDDEVMQELKTKVEEANRDEKEPAPA